MDRALGKIDHNASPRMVVLSKPDLRRVVIDQGAVDQEAEDLADALLPAPGEFEKGIGPVRGEEKANFDDITEGQDAGSRCRCALD